MKIVISNSDTGEIYDELNEVTASQIAAYSGCGVIVIDEDELIVESVVLEHDNQILNVLVVPSEEKEESTTPTLKM